MSLFFIGQIIKICSDITDFYIFFKEIKTIFDASLKSIRQTNRLVFHDKGLHV